MGASYTALIIFKSK